MDVMVFTPSDAAAIERVITDLSTLGGRLDHPLEFRRAEGIEKTREGLYVCEFPIPLLTDPGWYRLPVHAFDTKGCSGQATASLFVVYQRPSRPA